MHNKAENIIRKTTRKTFCRYCDGDIEVGEKMLSFYSSRNFAHGTGIRVHLHLECTIELGEFAQNADEY
jgi:hypothetical protein